MNSNACRPGFCCENGQVHCNHCRGRWCCRNTSVLVPVFVRQGGPCPLQAVSSCAAHGVQLGHPVGCAHQVGLSCPQMPSPFGTPSYLGNPGTSTSTRYPNQPGALVAPSYLQQAGTLGASAHFQRASAFGLPSHLQTCRFGSSSQCQQAGAVGAPRNLQHAGPFKGPQELPQVYSASVLQGTPQADSSSWSDGRQRRAPVLLSQVEKDDSTSEPECPENAWSPPAASDDQWTALPDARTPPPRQQDTSDDWSWVIVPVKRKRAMMEGTQPTCNPRDTSSLKK
ncbi:hypothetical protein ISCGN_021934 [Ixodes scapularis]